jgi:ABC-type phosphate/phosphonate transport system substrate-binding protein
VYNEGRSQSGWAAALNHAARLGTSFGPSFASGGHRLSALALAEGRADISVIDAQTWRMIRRWDTWAAGLKVIGLTDPTPATPFITSARNTPETAAAVALALRETVAEMSAEDRDTLSLRGIATVDEAAYLAVPTPA